MNRMYRYEIDGSAAQGQTWGTSGQVTCLFDRAFIEAVTECFMKLTKGEAVYGQPGVGCNGPYLVDRVLIVRLEAL